MSGHKYPLIKMQSIKGIDTGVTNACTVILVANVDQCVARFKGGLKALSWRFNGG